jgi:hypothetical protein
MRGEEMSNRALRTASFLVAVISVVNVFLLSALGPSGKMTYESSAIAILVFAVVALVFAVLSLGKEA